MNKFKKVVFIGGTSLLATGSAMAADYTAQIQAVQATAETNQAAVAGAVIAIAAVSFGLGLLVRWLR
ncbi:hypothetical protein VXM60_10470 [Shewanella khirikhana]|uniref:hypothetical protein n=1 Tax=Shewanella khirikhana TaxID=1965282 RepID=UPI0030D58690